MFEKFSAFLLNSILTLHVVLIVSWISHYRAKHGKDLNTILFTGSVPACVISVDNRRSFVLCVFVFAVHQKYLQHNYKDKIKLSVCTGAHYCSVSCRTENKLTLLWSVL